ncbi:MAG: hypothetical protein WAP23_02195 [Candidatus Spechtbacterales bacterium]
MVQRIKRLSTPDPRSNFFEEPECTFLTWKIGYRTWGIYKYEKDGSFVLFSDIGRVIWPKREELVAKCSKIHLRAHTSPFPRCQCGIYAMNSMEDVRNSVEDIRRKTFAGEVKLWGTILAYTEGVRAQFAYPASIRDVRCSKCDEYKKLEEFVFLSFYVTSRVSSIHAFCKKCEMLLPDLRYREKLDSSFLTQIAEDYGIEVGERRCEDGRNR